MKESLSAKKVLTFGVTMTIGEYAIVPALSKFVKLHPDTDFHIRYGNTQTLLSALHEGTIDFAIVEGYFQKEMQCRSRGAGEKRSYGYFPLQ